MQHSLADTITAHGPTVIGLLERHGAVLLRGWHVPSAEAFAASIGAFTRVAPLRCVRDYLPAESGREPLLCKQRSDIGSSLLSASPLTVIWPTNQLRRTGGYLGHEILPHTENYYALEMHTCGSEGAGGDSASATPLTLVAAPPRIVAFHCEVAPWLGGAPSVARAACSQAARPLRAPSPSVHVATMTGVPDPASLATPASLASRHARPRLAPDRR